MDHLKTLNELQAKFAARESMARQRVQTSSGLQGITYALPCKVCRHNVRCTRADVRLGAVATCSLCLVREFRERASTKSRRYNANASRR